MRGREIDIPSHPEIDRALAVAGAVPDPEIPAITLADLGVLRGAELRGDLIVVRLSPTYTGCPATSVIKLNVEAALCDAGFTNPLVEIVLAPAWTTDDITAEGRRKLTDYGIAPPNRRGGRGTLLFGVETVDCPRCQSTMTTRISEFGSTPCKSLWRCDSCREPFDYFKCL